MYIIPLKKVLTIKNFSKQKRETVNVLVPVYIILNHVLFVFDFSILYQEFPVTCFPFLLDDEVSIPGVTYRRNVYGHSSFERKSHLNTKLQDKWRKDKRCLRTPASSVS